MSRVALLCQSCRHHVLDSFASLAGLSIRPLPQTRAARPPVPWTQQQTPRKAFSTCIPRLENSKPQEKNEDNHTQNATPPDIETSSQSDTSQVPWYLQVSNPEPPAPTSPLLAVQELPPIPPNAPPILSPALEYLSVHMGLDNLSLLDLRGVDPPPALGANLIMILGTARSYKHLNTCADRFCRWLRSKYKLTPYADGLLGRNELKLRLRRKARRMKLAQSVGNTTMAEQGQDDGITTGWICVNAGTVDDAEIDDVESLQEEQVDGSRTATDQEEIDKDEEEYKNPADNYVGFGNRSMAPRIVVQMFVEEKRLEMDLEGLWNHRLLRKVDKAEKAAVEARQAVSETDIDSNPVAEPDSADDKGMGGQFRPFGGTVGR